METIFLTGMRNNILTSSFLPDPSLFRYHHDLKFCMFVISGIPFPSHFLLQTTPFLLKAWVSLQSLKMEGLKVSLVLFSFSSRVFLLSFLPQKCLPFQSLLWALYAPLPVIITVGLNYNFLPLAGVSHLHRGIREPSWEHGGAGRAQVNKLEKPGHK